MLGQATPRSTDRLDREDAIDTQLNVLEDTLPGQLAGRDASEQTVRNWVREERRRFRGASVRTFLPILVQRAVAERAGRPVSTAVKSLGPMRAPSAGT